MATVCQSIIYHRLADNMRQELVKDHPLVVPHGQTMGLEVSLKVGDRWILRSDEVHRVIMKQKEGRVQPGDHHVLIVAWVTDNRHVVNRISRQVLVLTAAFDQEFDWISRIV